MATAHPWSPLSTDGPMGRSVADVALLLSVIGQPAVDDPLSRRLRLPLRLDPPARPLRVAWSRDLGGLPVEAEQLAVLDRLRRVVEGLGWVVSDAEPDLDGADDCFLTLRAWQIATGPVGQLGERLEQVKVTVQDEVRRGRGLTPQEITDGLGRLARLRRRAIGFFDRYDLLLAPVTQVAPFPIGWEHPHEIEGVEMAHYTSWMASCYRITVLGAPALSLPAGFDARGRPVGIQVVGRPGGDLGVLRAAAALETHGEHRRHRPDIDALAAAGPAGFGPAAQRRVATDR